MTQLLVIADDLTGALDTGVQLAKQGISTEVRIFSDRETASEESEPSSLVVVADTESRHLTAEAAFQRVRDAALWGRSMGIKRFYKKTDSTLRGNIGPELAALLEAGDGGPLVFAPAFPALGRTTRGGRQYVDGVPLEKTAFAADRLNPITTSLVGDILRKDTSLHVSTARPEALSAMLRDAGSPGAGEAVIVVDGETGEDLAETARQILSFVAAPASRTGDLPPLAGCAGFAAYLPALLGIAEGEADRIEPTSPLLAVNGSLNPVSLAQIRAAVSGGFRDLPLGPADIASPEGRRMATDGLAALLSEGCPAVLRNVLSPDEVDDYCRAAESKGISRDEMHLVMPRAYGEIIRDLVSRVTVGTLAVFGGDTLVGILEAFGKKSIVPLAEVFPGVVLARIPGVVNPRYILTKAGGFGGEDLLLKIRDGIGTQSGPGRS